MRTSDPAEGYLDEEFAKFRARRLAKEQERAARATAALDPAARPQAAAPPAPAPTPTAPSPTEAEPRTVEVVEEPEGDLDFERFRARRLRESARRRAVEADATPPSAAPPADEGLFFGTSTAERRQARATARDARTSDDGSGAAA